jgi:ribosome-binding factor A
MRRSRSEAPSQRQLRVGEELRHALVRSLARTEFDDPELAEANVTVTQVAVSPDLKNATAYVLPLGGTRTRETVAALNRAAGYLRGQLSREVVLRYTPRLAFKADESFEQAQRIDDALHQPRVQRDLEAAGGGEEPERGT